MSPNEGTHTFSKARVMPKVFTDLRAGETMNAESDLLSFSSITASPVHSLSVDCAGELKVGGANAFYTPGGRLSMKLCWPRLMGHARLTCTFVSLNNA